MAEALSLLDRTRIRQHIDRNWASLLKGNEYKVAMLVFDRTLAWGDHEKAISVPEFCRGRGNYTKGTGLSERTVHRVIAALCGKGVLTKRGHKTSGRKNVYSLNLRWGMDEGDNMLAPSKHNRNPNAQTTAKPAVGERAQEGETTANLTGHIKGRKISKGPVSAERPLAVSKQVRKSLPPEKTSVGTVIANAEAVRDRVTAERKTSEKVSDATALWTDLFREHWPDAACVSWSPKARGHLGFAIKNRAFRDLALGEFLTWVIRDWTLITKAALGWMKSVPAAPDPEFVMINVYRLLQAQANISTLKAEAEMKGRRGEIARLRRFKGMSSDDAAEAIQKREDVGAKAQEVVDDLRHQLAQERAASARKDAFARKQAPRPATPDRSAMNDFDRE